VCSLACWHVLAIKGANCQVDVAGDEHQATRRGLQVKLSSVAGYLCTITFSSVYHTGGP